MIEWPAHPCPWFIVCLQKVGRLENMIGWYHSHPGYGCWLSGIDVGTQATQQMYQEPFLAIVIDPHRTIAAGKVEIGAFRTYPEVRCSITFLCNIRLLFFAGSMISRLHQFLPPTLAVVAWLLSGVMACPGIHSDVVAHHPVENTRKCC